MENIKQIMDLFDSAEKWSAYIELSNYREDLVKYYCCPVKLLQRK